MTMLIDDFVLCTELLIAHKTTCLIFTKRAWFGGPDSGSELCILILKSTVARVRS